jgi:hypothetical protein
MLVPALAGCTTVPAASPAASAAATQASASPSSALAPFHIIVLGDSIAAGYAGGFDIPDRWWRLAASGVQRARPDRDVAVKNLAEPGSGIVHLERTADGVDRRDYQVAVIIEGRNDVLDDIEWLPRFRAVIEKLESRGLVVVLGTYPPTFRDRAFEVFTRNDAIRTVAGSKRPLLDFEARWLAAGPATAAAWYADVVHANAAGQVIEGEIATMLLLSLVN